MRRIKKFLEISTDGLLTLYLVIMISYYIYSSLLGLHTYEEYDPTNFTHSFNKEQYYSSSEIRTIQWRYYLFYLFNAACILLITWYDPRKRKKIIKLEERIKEWLGA